jgi:hypothetical protein
MSINIVLNSVDLSVAEIEALSSARREELFRVVELHNLLQLHSRDASTPVTEGKGTRLGRFTDVVGCSKPLAIRF